MPTCCVSQLTPVRTLAPCSMDSSGANPCRRTAGTYLATSVGTSAIWSKLCCVFALPPARPPATSTMPLPMAAPWHETIGKERVFPGLRVGCGSSAARREPLELGSTGLDPWKNGGTRIAPSPPAPHGSVPEFLGFVVPFLARMGRWQDAEKHLGLLEMTGNLPLFREAAVG